MEPERRLEIARKIVSAAGDYGIPPEDVVIDPLAMPVGAEPRAVTLFVETVRLIRDELGVNTTCGASNTAFGLPAAQHARRGVPLDRAVARPDERDHGRALAGVRRRGARGRPPARPRRVGGALDRELPREAGGGGVVSAAETLAVTPQTDRVRLRFEPGRERRRREGGARARRARRSSTRRAGTAIAIDSTCGGHGTCKKCKVRVVVGHAAGLRRRPARVLGRGARRRAGGSRAGRPPRRTSSSRCRRCRRGRRRRSSGVGRHVILRPGGAEALPRAVGADARGPDAPTSSACSPRWTTSSCACRSTLVRDARRHAARRPTGA